MSLQITWRYNRNKILLTAISIVKKIIIWLLIFNILHIFHKSNDTYIKKFISDKIVQTLTVLLFIGLLFCLGYVTIIILFGTEKDIEKTCYYIIQHHIAIVISLICYEFI